MYFSMVELMKIGTPFMVILSCYTISAEVEDEKILKLNPGFDLILETNGVPSLRISNFEGSARKRIYKRSFGADSSSESEEREPVKNGDAKKTNLRDIRESERSDEGGSSDSDGERRLSTKGFFLPDDFEAERSSNVNERFVKDSDSE